MRWMAVMAVISVLGADARGAEKRATTQEVNPIEKNLAVEQTNGGELKIQPLNHSALRFEFKGKQYYVDPAGVAPWDKLPKADVILITHEHRDHLDPKVIATIRKPDTQTLMNASSVKAAGFGQTINVGEKVHVGDVNVEAVPAYNVDPKRPFHPRDRKDNGYVITFGDKRVYVAGDTEGTPEMKALENIDIAFVPINLPYTMTPQAAAEAARAFKPKILYPYHQGKSDPKIVKNELADVKEIEVRVLELP